MPPCEVKKDIYWVGAIDWNIRDFHGYSTYMGTTYNAYLVLDEKVTLFDTVKKPFMSDLIHNIHKIVKPEEIDYLVVNHVEMDHSGNMPEIIERIKPEKVFCSKMAEKGLRAHFHRHDWPLEVVETGTSLSLGNRSVTFLETRMLHWPDSMFSYIPEEKLLISSDAFGQHWATSERFDDEVNTRELMAHAAKYYANIILLYSRLVQKLIKTVGELGIEIDMIAPDHGLIWRGEPGRIIEAYDKWSRQEAINKAVIIYDTMWHSTETMANAVADGLVQEGVSVKMMSLKASHRSDVMTEVLDAKAVLFGSPTLNNGLFPTIADMLCYMKGLKPRGKIGAAFGSYGWSGEAVKLMTKAMEEMGFDIAGSVRIQFVPEHEGLKECVDLGRKVARAMKEA